MTNPRASLYSGSLMFLTDKVRACCVCLAKP